MAEPENILQLGIEAAREGDKKHARELFRLLTRQEPQNLQAWLWLAGVAEDRDERQAALERVIALDPDNEMATKGLQALNVSTSARSPELPAETVVEPPAPPPSSEPTVNESSSIRDRYDVDEDDPFAALDTLSEVMSESPAAVRRTEPYPISSEEQQADRSSSRVRTGASRRAQRTQDDTETTVPARRGVSCALVGLVIAALLIVGGIFIWQRFFSGTESNIAVETSQPAAGTTINATTETVAGSEETVPSPDEAESATPGETETAPTEATVETEEPTEEISATTEPVIPPEEANPQILAANTPLESNGWLYDFNQPTYATPVVGNLGSFQPQGQFVIVLAFAVNRTGQDQPIPPDFFVLKDAQGRVYEAQPEISSAYVIPGANADLSHQQPLPADGITRSVALIFDVAPDATNLVFFARSNPDQGWLVLERM